MPSSIDATKPVDDVAAEKSDLRDNLAAAETEINHGGFFTHTGTGVVERQSQARQRDFVSVKDFGALGNSNGTTGNGNDDTAEIQAALDAHGIVYLPPGIYRITASLVIPDEGGMVGASNIKTVIYADSITSSTAGLGAAIRFSPESQEEPPLENQTLAHLQVSGICETGVACSYTQGSRIHDVYVSATVTNAFWFYYCWGCSFTHLNTNNATIDEDDGAAFKCLDAYAANYAANWYVGGQSRAFYGVHVNTLDTLPPRCNVWNMMTMQSCRYGFYAEQGQGVTINGLYTENTVTPLRIGDGSASHNVRGLALQGGALGGPLASHSYYASRTACVELDYGYGISIQGCDFDAVFGDPPTLEVIHYKKCGMVFVAGNYVPKDGLRTDLTQYTKRMTSAETSAGLVIMQDGENGQLEMVMKADGFAYRHYKMNIDSSGAWVATEWIPAAA